MQSTIQAVPKDLLIRVLKKLKPDYEIFNYEIPLDKTDSKPSILTSNLGFKIVIDENSPN